jgi:NADH-quinone oxidoreductase subunit J
MLNAIFYISGFLMVACAFRAVTSPYIFRAALFLAASLAFTAVQYLLMQAEFVAIVQLLVYVGAVIILIIFAVMMTAQLGDGSHSQANHLSLPAGLICLLLALGLGKMILHFDWSKAAAVVPSTTGTALSPNNIQAIGSSLMDVYAFPLEITGLLLFTALVGAVLIARKESPR